jgi:cell division protein FtsW (lipid II flippase)
MYKLLQQRERSLLGIVTLIILNALLAVLLPSGSVNFQALTVALGIAMLAFFVHFLIRFWGHSGDPYILPLAVLLSGFGLVMVFRLKPQLLMLQATWIALGLVVFGVSAFLFRQLEQLSEYKYISGIVGVILLLTAIAFGVDIGGNKNWVLLGPVRFQPSEFAKLFIVIFLAAYFNDRKELLTYATRNFGLIEIPHARFLGPLIAVWGITMLMLVVQRDLGSALLYFGTFILMAYLASGRISYFIFGIFFFMVGASVFYKLFPHVQTRVDIWLNPWADPNGRSYQVVQSLFAMGSGGVLGAGLGFGLPDTIPEVHTDFIFAAIGEELGLAGAGAIMAIYTLLIYRGFHVAIMADKPFTKLVAGGLSVFMALQIFLIIGGVTKFLPLTGITLPLISYGGSSVVSNFILLGMLFAISEARSENV